MLVDDHVDLVVSTREKGMGLVNDFRLSLGKELSKKQLQVSAWQQDRSRSRNLLEINTEPLTTILYVKMSTSKRKFWGLTENQLKQLRMNEVRWFVVLLAGAVDQGFVFTEHEVEVRIQNRRFRLSGDGDYKINEGTDCTAEESFCGLTALLARIL